MLGNVSKAMLGYKDSISYSQDSDVVGSRSVGDLPKTSPDLASINQKYYSYKNH